MEENEIISEETVTGGEGVTSAEGSKTVSDGISLKELNEIYGTTFKTKEDALRSVKETKSFVGKRKEDIIAETKTSILSEIKELGIDTSNFVTKAQLEEEKFYAGNPGLVTFKDIINAVKKDKNISFDEVIQLEQFKPLLKTGTSDSSEKSVIHSKTVKVADDTDIIGKARQTGRDEDWAMVMKQLTAKE